MVLAPITQAKEVVRRRERERERACLGMKKRQREWGIFNESGKTYGVCEVIHLSDLPPPHLQMEDKNPQRVKRAMGSDDASGSSTPSKRRRNGGDVSTAMVETLKIYMVTLSQFTLMLVLMELMLRSRCRCLG